MNKTHLTLTAATLLCTAAYARTVAPADTTLDRTVVVENLYNPDIMKADKVNLLPTIEEPQAVRKEINYVTETRPQTLFPFMPMANNSDAPAAELPAKGYLRAGYGTGGNADARFGYRFTLGERDVLNTSLTFRGMDGSRDFPEETDGRKEWDVRDYHTQAAIDWAHRFDCMTLTVKADGENRVFNYLNGTGFGNNHQHNLSAGLQLGLKSSHPQARIRWEAGTGIHYGTQKYAIGEEYGTPRTRLGETLIHTYGTAEGQIDEQSSIRLHAELDNLFCTDTPLLEDGDNTRLALNPTYHRRGDNWRLHAGLQVSLLFNRTGENYNALQEEYKKGSALRVAPDVYGELLLGGKNRFYLQATGGDRLNDFRTITTAYPHSHPLFAQADGMGYRYYLPTQTFTQLDARLGFNSTPMNELALHAYGGWRTVTGELFQTLDDAQGTPFTNLMQGEANVLYLGASAQYAWKDFLTTRAELEWNKWDSDLIDRFLTLTPELTFAFTADFQPLEGLHIALDYRFVQRCKTTDGERPDALNNLSLTGSYRLLDNLDLFLSAHNLLGAKYYQEVFLPAQGIHFLAGASVSF